MELTNEFAEVTNVTTTVNRLLSEKVWRRGSESNRRIKVLQTSPLPLGYRAFTTKPAMRRV
jgi:hypothetical protein